MAQNPKAKSIPDATLKQLALSVAANCVRNTVIEGYHARGSLSQEDMKQFNQEVANKLYTFLRILFNGSPNQTEALFKTLALLYPHNWDKPVIDKDLDKAIKFMLKNSGELP